MYFNFTLRDLADVKFIDYQYKLIFANIEQQIALSLRITTLCRWQNIVDVLLEQIKCLSFHND